MTELAKLHRLYKKTQALQREFLKLDSLAAEGACRSVKEALCTLTVEIIELEAPINIDHVREFKDPMLQEEGLQYLLSRIEDDADDEDFCLDAFRGELFGNNTLVQEILGNPKLLTGGDLFQFFVAREQASELVQ